MMSTSQYQTTIPGGSHWSLRLRKGTQLTLTDLEGGANVGMLFYNPEDLLERYNAPDTLKCQHTFKLTKGNCLYSDMGRIFCSIVEDSLGWHETVCGNISNEKVKALWGGANYQDAGNDWQLSGYSSFLVELAKYGLGVKDMASNLNLFSKVAVNKEGELSLSENHSEVGSKITLRFEMDTLLVLHTCPHPMSTEKEYPSKPVGIEISDAPPVSEDDCCLTHCSENTRGFENNRLYHLGV